MRRKRGDFPPPRMFSSKAANVNMKTLPQINREASLQKTPSGICLMNTACEQPPIQGTVKGSTHHPLAFFFLGKDNCILSGMMAPEKYVLISAA